MCEATILMLCDIELCFDGWLQRVQGLAGLPGMEGVRVGVGCGQVADPRDGAEDSIRCSAEMCHFDLRISGLHIR